MFPNNKQIVTFVGHRDAYISKQKKREIKEHLQELIRMGIKTFWIGANGNFDGTCATILKELKDYYEDICVCAVSPYVSESYLKELKRLVSAGYYDEIIYPPIENVPPKYAIWERNKYMIDNADFLLTFIDINIGGAYKSMEYAKSIFFPFIHNFGSLKI